VAAERALAARSLLDGQENEAPSSRRLAPSSARPRSPAVEKEFRRRAAALGIRMSP
jgi:hypothetical protein